MGRSYTGASLAIGRNVGISFRSDASLLCIIWALQLSCSSFLSSFLPSGGSFWCATVSSMEQIGHVLGTPVENGSRYVLLRASLQPVLLQGAAIEHSGSSGLSTAPVSCTRLPCSRISCIGFRIGESRRPCSVSSVLSPEKNDDNNDLEKACRGFQCFFKRLPANLPPKLDSSAVNTAHRRQSDGTRRQARTRKTGLEQFGR